jgi:hypothetical protein
MTTTTPNFGWSVPVSTDLVKDGATAIELLGDSIDTSLVDLKGGTTGQVLAKASGTDLDFSWVAQDDSNAIQNAIVDAKGDLIGATAADTPARLAVGTDGQVLTADSAEATGMKWATAASGGGMTSIASGSLSGAGLSLTSISGSYKNLQLVLRGAKTSAQCDWRFKINNNTGAIYGFVKVLSPGSSTFASQADTNSTSFALNYNNPSASVATSIVMDFPDYANTVSPKLIDWKSTYTGHATGNEDTILGLASALDLNAVTQLDVFLTSSATFSAGTYTLYGVN